MHKSDRLPAMYRKLTTLLSLHAKPEAHCKSFKVAAFKALKILIVLR